MPLASLYICHGKNGIEWWKTIRYGYIGGELLLKLKLNSSLKCIEIRMHNVGVKNVSVRQNRELLWKAQAEGVLK
jgi:hypothetical protein